MPIRKALSALALVSMVSVLLVGLTPVVAQSQPPPPIQPRGPQQRPRPAFGDVFGRFRVSLPSGATPMGATLTAGPGRRVGEFLSFPVCRMTVLGALGKLFLDWHVEGLDLDFSACVA